MAQKFAVVRLFEEKAEGSDRQMVSRMLVRVFDAQGNRLKSDDADGGVMIPAALASHSTLMGEVEELKGKGYTVMLLDETGRA